MKNILITIAVVLFLIVAILDISVGCPPPPFAHKCLMKQAGAIPHYGYSNDN